MRGLEIFISRGLISIAFCVGLSAAAAASVGDAGAPRPALHIKASLTPVNKPALRIRPRRAADFLESLGIAETAVPGDAAPNIETSLRAGANTVLVTWRKWTSGHSPAVAAPVGANDPFEELNRLTFGFNSSLRDHVLDPLSEYYLKNTTEAVRQGVRNFFGNIREPLSIASWALEGNVANAGNATARFAINTTIGIAGVYDRAAELGFPKNIRDLEATTCAYGVPAGPYVVLPVLGPATLRDALVRLTTMAVYMEAMGLTVYIPYRGASIAAQYADIRDKKEFIEAISLDPYVAYRTLYVRMRNMSCGHGVGDEQYFTR